MTNFFSRLDTLELSLAGKVFDMTFEASLAGLAVTYLQIKTAAKKPILLGYQLSSSSEPLLAEAFETPTLTDGTSEVTAYNLKRSSAIVATTRFYTNPTSVSGGTKIQALVVTAGKGGGAVATEQGAWQLNTSTNYVWKITNLTNQTTRVSGQIQFAEDYGQF